MKQLKISRDSWHYSVLMWNRETTYSPPTNLCGYFWATLVHGHLMVLLGIALLCGAGVCIFLGTMLLAIAVDPIITHTLGAYYCGEHTQVHTFLGHVALESRDYLPVYWVHHILSWAMYAVVAFIYAKNLLGKSNHTVHRALHNQAQGDGFVAITIQFAIATKEQVCPTIKYLK